MAIGPSNINDISLLVGSSIIPYAITFVTIVGALLLKEFVTSVSKGLMFKIGSSFAEGDHVLLDGDQTIIVKIGLLTSVFGIMKLDKTYCWRYIPNQSVGSLKLEKIIIQKDEVTPTKGK